MSAIARRCISLPKYLDDEMTAVRGVSWSAIAQAAFRSKLDSIRDEKIAEEKRRKEHAARLAVIESGSGY